MDFCLNYGKICSVEPKRDVFFKLYWLLLSIELFSICSSLRTFCPPLYVASL